MLHLFFTKQFNSYIWKKQQEKRPYYLKSLLTTNFIIGKSQDEVELLLGKNESCSQKENRWTYELHAELKTHKKYFLAIYFENGKVIKTRKEFKTLY